MGYFIFPFIVFIAVVALIPLAIKLAPVLKLVDVPDSRKQHEGAVPLIGGLIIFPVFIGGAVLAGFGFSEYWPLYAAITLLLVTGAVDDRLHIHAWLKFFVQFIAAALVILPGEARVHHLGDLFSLGTMGLDFMWLPFSFAAVVLLINAINLMDGLDGLSAGISAVVLGWLAYGFYSADYVAEFQMVLMLVAAVCGFLIYNMRYPFRKKASLFLGDAGSLCLGLSLAWFAIHAGKSVQNPALMPMSVAWVLAIPIMDTCAQFYRRKREGKHPFSADRGHFHHHFVHAGMSDGRAVALILMLAFIGGAFGVLWVAFGLPQIVITLLWITLLLSHIAYSEKPQRYISLIEKVAKR